MDDEEPPRRIVLDLPSRAVMSDAEAVAAANGALARESPHGIKVSVEGFDWPDPWPKVRWDGTGWVSD